MRILYLSQYFPPEVGATQTRAYEMARRFTALGHQVTLLAEFPNHPGGVIPARYRGKLVERETLEGIEVIRVWVKASPVKTFRTRMLFYLSYMVSAFLAGLLLARGRCDLILASSPPLFVGGAALGLSWLRRIPLVFEVRDLWPESAAALGEISNPRLIALATRLEEACYRRARRVVVVTEGIRRRLVERGVPEQKVVLVPNGANVELFQFRPERREALRASLGLEGRFAVIYAGLHGLAYDLESVIEAAELLRAEGGAEPAFHFVLVGEGPKKGWLRREVERRGLENVLLLPEQPLHVLPDYLSAADAALIPLRDLELFKGTLPVKLFDAWACELPVVMSVEGEARQLMEAAGGGLYAAPEDPAAVVAALKKLRARPDLARAMGGRGRRYTEAHFSRQALADKLLAELEKVAAGG